MAPHLIIYANLGNSGLGAGHARKSTMGLNSSVFGPTGYELDLGGEWRLRREFSHVRHDSVSHSYRMRADKTLRPEAQVLRASSTACVSSHSDAGW